MLPAVKMGSCFMTPTSASDRGSWNHRSCRRQMQKPAETSLCYINTMTARWVASELQRDSSIGSKAAMLETISGKVVPYWQSSQQFWPVFPMISF